MRASDKEDWPFFWDAPCASGADLAEEEVDDPFPEAALFKTCRGRLVSLQPGMGSTEAD